MSPLIQNTPPLQIEKIHCLFYVQRVFTNFDTQININVHAFPYTQSDQLPHAFRMLSVRTTVLFSHHFHTNLTPLLPFLFVRKNLKALAM